MWEVHDFRGLSAVQQGHLLWGARPLAGTWDSQFDETAVPTKSPKNANPIGSIWDERYIYQLFGGFFTVKCR